MAKGSQSQAATNAGNAGKGQVARGPGSPGPQRGQIQRRAGGKKESGPGGQQGTAMRFYTDDSPGLKISPIVVLMMSAGFILFVTVLHIIGKLTG